MTSEEAVIGAKVRVGESGWRSEWWGLTGTISGRWETLSTWPSTCCWRTGARSSFGTTSSKR